MWRVLNNLNIKFFNIKYRISDGVDLIRNFPYQYGIDDIGSSYSPCN